MEKAEEAEQIDLPDAMSIPEEIARREGRVERICEVKQTGTSVTIEGRAREQREEEKTAYEEKMGEGREE